MAGKGGVQGIGAGDDRASTETCRGAPSRAQTGRADPSPATPPRTPLPSSAPKSTPTFGEAAATSVAALQPSSPPSSSTQQKYIPEPGIRVLEIRKL